MHSDAYNFEHFFFVLILAGIVIGLFPMEPAIKAIAVKIIVGFAAIIAFLWLFRAFFSHV